MRDVLRQPFVSRVLWAGLIIVVLLGGLHLPFARRLVLASASARLEAETGIAASAARVSYNLLILEIDLHEIVLAAGSRPPFARIDRARLNLAWSSLWSGVRIDEIEVIRPRVTLVPGAEGTLPAAGTEQEENEEEEATADAAGPAPRLALGRVRVNALDLSWNDPEDDLAVEINGLDLTLEPTEDDRSTGALRLLGTASVRSRRSTTLVERLEADLVFDGTDLDIERSVLAVGFASVELDGQVRSLLAVPELDLTVRGSAELEQSIRAAGAEIDAAGVVRLDGRLRGAAASPDVTLTWTGESLRLGTFDDVGLSADLSVSSATVVLDTIEAELAGGRLSGSGRLDRVGPNLGGTLDAEWASVDVETMLRGADLGPAVTPFAGVADGALSLAWAGTDPSTVEGSFEARLRPPASESPSGLAAQLRLELSDGQWTARLEQQLGTVARIEASGGGALSPDGFSATTLAAVLDIDITAIDDAARMLGGRDVALTGSIRGTLELAGTLGDPSLTGMFTGRDIVYAGIGPAILTGRVAGNRAEIRIDAADVIAGPNSARVNVRVDLDTADINGQVDAQLGDLAQVAAAWSPAWRPSGSATATVNVTGRSNEPRLAVEIQAREVAVAGFEVDTLTVGAQAGPDGVVVDRFDARLADARLILTGRFDPATGRYMLHTTADGLPLRPTARLPWPSATVGWSLDGNGTLADPRGSGRLELSDVAWRGRTVDRVDLTLDLAGNLVDLHAIAAELGLDARARIDLARGTYELTAEIDELNPGRLVAADERSTELTGTLSLTLQSTGPLTDPSRSTASVELRVFDATLGGAPLRLTRPATVRYADDRVEIEAFTLAIGATRLTIDGRISSSPADRLEASLIGDVGEAVSLLSLAAGVPAPAVVLTGSMQTRLSVVGPLAQPIVEANLEITGGRVTLDGLPPLTEVEVRTRYQDRALVLERLHGAWQGATIDATGRTPIVLWRDFLPERLVGPQAATGPGRFDARFERLTPDLLTPFVDPATRERLSGRIDATLALEASAWSRAGLRGELTLSHAELTTAGVPIAQRLPTRFELRDSRVEIAAWEWGAAENNLTLSGHVSIADDPELDVTATGQLDLRILGAVLGLAATGGGATLDARLHGRASAPQLTGSIALEDAALRIAEPAIAITALTGSLILDGQCLRTRDLAGIANGGTLTLDGELGLAGWRVTDGTLLITGRGLAMNVPEGLRTEVDADLTVTRSAEATTLGGTLTLVRGDYRDPLSLTSGVLATLQAQTAAAEIEGAPGALDEWSLNARLVTAEDLVVDNNYANLELGAELQLVGTLAQPALAGRVTIREGGQVFLGRNTYEIDSGAIDFTNPRRIEPNLTLTARTRVSGHDITLNLNGTVDNFQSQLSASPTETEPDIVSLLLTGRTLDEAGGAAGVIAREQALGLVSADALGAAGRVVGLDTLRLDATGGRDVRFDSSLVATETDPGARLTFGKNVSRDVQLIFSQSLKETGSLTWIVNYAPRRGLQLRGIVLDDNDRSYEFRHAVSFGDAPRLADGPNRPRSTAEPTPRRVSAVQFTGAPVFDGPTLARELDISAGDRFEFYRWQRDQDRLERFYHEHGHREVRIRARRIDHGDSTVRLEYEIDSGPQTALVVEGYDPPGELRRAMEAAWTRSVFDGFLLDELQTMTTAHLASRGFVQASVEAAVEADDPGSKTIVVSIAPGPRSASREFAVTGNTGIGRDQLEQQLAASGADITAWVDPRSAAEPLTALYRSQGWLRARVSVASPTFAGETATLPIRIDEGPRSRISTVTVTGQTALSEPEVRDVLGLAPGSVYTPAALQAAQRRLDGRYRTDGFNAATVSTTSVIDEPEGDVAVQVTIDEGARQVLDSIAVTGIFRTHPGVVERALQLTPGEPVDLESWFEARRRLYNSGVFRSVNIEAEPIATARSPADDEPVRARVTVEEWPAYQLRYGVQVADENAPLREASGRTLRPGLAADLTRSNLLGRAATVGVSTRYNTVQRAARGFLAMPSLFGVPLTTSLFVSRDRERLNRDTALPLVADLSTVTIEQRFRPGSNLVVAYSYNFERNHTFNETLPSDDLGFVPIPFDVTIDIARLNTTALLDTRDDLVEPTRGWFHSSNFEYAPEGLGSDVRFVKYLAQQFYYRPIGRGVILASAVRLGLARAFEQELIPSERFVAGGGNTVRGYREDSLGPTDFLGNVVGGNALLIVNQEVRFPVVGRFGGVAFFDAGNAFNSVRDLSLADLRMSLGLGLRVQTPFALLRADYGARLRRRSGEPSGRWFFSIGHAF